MRRAIAALLMPEEVPMSDLPPSRVRVLSETAVSATEVRILMEVIVDVNRLAEVGQRFLSQAIRQVGIKKPEHGS